MSLERDEGRYAPATELLAAELPDRRFEDPSFLSWLYDANPLGPSFVAEAYEESTIAAHYGLVRQTYRDAEGEAPFVFSLNAVTRSGTQRRGYFSQLGRKVWGDAAADGIRAVVGVTNDKSITPVRRQGWRLLCRLPVLVLPALPSRGFESVAARAVLGDALSAGGWLSGWDEAPVMRWANAWSPELLRWRLGWPGCGPYALHRDGETMAVSTVTRVAGVPVAVILKLATRSDTPVRGAGAVGAACAFHRAPAAIYAGFNSRVTLRGWPLPDRFRPAPLNLMVHSLSAEIPVETFALDTFELLDMDAL